MPGVKAESNGLSVSALQPTVGAQNHHVAAPKRLRTPAHSHVLAQAEEVAGWLMEKHVGRQGQRAGRTRGMRRHIKERRVAGIENSF